MSVILVDAPERSEQPQQQQERHESSDAVVLLETSHVQVGGWKGTADTHDLIEQTHKTYLASKKKAEE